MTSNHIHNTTQSNQSQKTATVVGATGLVGAQIVNQLLRDDKIACVIVLGRRSCKSSINTDGIAADVLQQKLQEHIINFDDPASWEHLVRGDMLFSALGTTLKAAGSQEAQYKIDYTYQYVTAKAAAKNKVPAYTLISSSGASPDSRIFYSRMKGELERDTKALGFAKANYIQPGILSGDRSNKRNEKRTGEEIALALVNCLPAWDFLAAARPFPVEIVAKAAIKTAFDDTMGVRTFGPREIFRLVA